MVREQADREALRNAAARRELLSAVEVAYTWNSILRDLRAGFLALPGRVQVRLPHLSVADVAVIDREVRDCLTSLEEDEL